MKTKTLSGSFFVVFALAVSEGLDLNANIEEFSNCTIHIILHTINSTSIAGFNHVLSPTRIPFILTQQVFNETSKRSDLKCFNSAGVYNFEIESIGEFKFDAKPPERRLCTVQIYVDPKPCLLWSLPIQVGPQRRWHEFFFLPGSKCLSSKSHIATIFDTRIFSYHHRRAFPPSLSARHDWYVVNVKSIHRYKSAHIPHYGFHDVFVPILLSNYRCSWVREFTTYPFLLIWEVNNNGKIIGNYILDTKSLFKNFTIATDPYCTQIMVDNLNQRASKLDVAQCRQKLKNKAPTYTFVVEFKRNLDLISLFRLEYTALMYNDIQNSRLNLDLPKNLEEVEWLNAMFPNFSYIKSFDLVIYRDVLPAVTFEHKLGMWQNLYWPNHNPLHFVSCTRKETNLGISFLGYVSAFDLYSWIGLIISSILTGLFLSLVVMTERFSSFMYTMVEILLCQGIDNVTIKNFKLILGPWLIAGIIFSYGFQGDNIKQFTTPQQVKPMDSLSEITDANFTIYSSPNGLNFLSLVDCVQQLVKKGTQEPVGRCIAQELRRYRSTMEMSIKAAVYEMSRNKTSMESKLLELVRNPKTAEEYRQIYENRVQFFLEKLKTCNNVAYGDVLSEVLIIQRAVLDSNKIKNNAMLHVSSIPYRQLSKWFLSRQFPVHPKLFNLRQYSLYQSGLWTYWSNLQRLSVEQQNRMVGEQRKYALEQPKPIGISYNIQTIFYVSISLLIPAGFLLCVEILIGRNLGNAFATSVLILLTRTAYFWARLCSLSLAQFRTCKMRLLACFIRCAANCQRVCKKR